MLNLGDIAKYLSDPAVVYAARYGIGLLFLLAAVSKARNYSIFRATMLDYQLIPQAFLSTAAALVLILECLIPVGALSGTLAPISMLIAAVLLLAYGTAIGVNLIRGRRDIDCGCTGPAVRQSLSGWLLVRNTVLALIALVAVTEPIERTMSVLDYVLVVIVVAAATAIYAAANQLMANLPRLDSLDALMETS